MTETADARGTDLTPAEAAQTIERARGYEEPLRRRTEGVTWMIWGLVAAGIQLSFNAVHDYVSHGWPGWVDPIILLGWPLVGLLMTFGVWRIAVLDRPGLRQHRWRSLLGAALWLPLAYLGIGLTFLITGIGWEGAFLPLVGIGVTWLVLGAANVFKATPTGRRNLVAIGAIILATTIGIALAVDVTSDLGSDITQLAAIFVAGGVPFLAGLLQSVRG